MRQWMLLVATSMVAWYLPVLTHRKSKYFFYFLINSLVDPVYVVLRYAFHLGTYDYIPFALLIEAATLPVNDTKSRTISTAALFIIVLNLGSSPFLELIVCEVVLSMMISNLLQDTFSEIKRESAFRVFHLLLLIYFLRNGVMFYFYYTNQGFLTDYYILFLIVIIIIPILIAYFGSNHKIAVNKKILESLPVVKKFYSEIPETESLYKETGMGISEWFGIYFEKPENNLLVDKKSEYGLTEREYEILMFVRKGLTSKEIAEKLCLSKRTVDNHRFAIKQKLGVSRKPETMKQIEKITPPRKSKR